MPTILDEILAVKRDEVAALRPRQAEYEAACRDAPPVRSLAEALRRTPPEAGEVSDSRFPVSDFGPIRILAEVKHQSPSAGVICDPFEPGRLARAYEGGGADAVSCLTDREFFGGSIADLREVRAAVDLPILRKDFLIDDVQIFEARAAGADAVLLIAEALEPGAMADLAAMARGIGMDVLAEAHGEAALDAAVGCGARLVGINNRDLATFEVDLGTTERLAPRVREAGRALVAESGIKTAADVSRLLACGCDATLVGEGLLRSGDMAGKLAEFKAAR